MIRILVPMQPPREVSANYHGHWRARAGAVAAYRECAYLAVLAEGGAWGDVASWPVVILDAEIAWGKGRKLVDDTNAAHLLKAAIDGLSDALWGGQDRHVRLGTVSQTRGGGTTTFTLREG